MNKKEREKKTQIFAIVILIVFVTVTFLSVLIR
ncbi:DUF4044 domain-containing protein [Hathewaya histolytica]|uniref:DUF4044 domain-containing protein n=1 Tax=Hathewaya histolytica TaxID=1498 RepID=A0A4U9REA9_HATHI|nr:Uncharacterised protein [Hathewaya histolytica]